MSKEKQHQILYIDGSKGTQGDFPVAVIRYQKSPFETEGESPEYEVIDPIFMHEDSRNLYGRIMTLLEATSDPEKLKAVKDVFSKELGSWERELRQRAEHLNEGTFTAGSTHHTRN